MVPGRDQPEVGVRSSRAGGRSATRRMKEESDPAKGEAEPQHFRLRVSLGETANQMH